MKSRTRKKGPFGLSLRTIFTLLAMAEILITIGTAWLTAAILDRFFHITIVMNYTVWLLIFSLVLGIMVSYFLNSWFFKPISRLGEAMGDVAGGDFHTKLETTSRFQEIQEIYGDFNRMIQELESTEILQTDFVTNVSHEFKTPINAIEGYAMLLQGSGQSETEQQQYIDKILSNTRRLSDLVGNILLLSKIDNQAIQSRQTRYRLDEQIRRSILLLEPKWVKKEIDFDVELQEINYKGNESLLLHVWNNLLDNAIKFNPVGGRIRMRLEEEQQWICFTIEDQGPGISQAAKKHIFDRFYQSDSSHREEGNGLGLALVRQILDTCGGRIAVDNLESGGCVFTVKLPK